MKREFGFWMFCILWVAVLLFVFGYCLSADAQTWDWSPRATHHRAACEVRSGDRGGSGIYVSFGNLRGVLTAAHVMLGDRATVKFSDGVEVTAVYTTDKFGHDVAFIRAIHHSITPVPMSQRDPSIGERVELLTYGGPANKRLRSFWAIVGSIDSTVTRYNCDVLSGDSGGGILNLGRELVGIEAHGYDKIETQKEWHAYRGAGSANTKIIRDFLQRVAEVPGRIAGRCGPKGCPEPKSPPSLNPFYPPLGPHVQPQLPPEQLPPVTPPPAEIDYSELAEMILSKINLDDLRGPDGSDGTRGARGPQGPKGVVGEPGPTGSQGSSGNINLDDLAERIKKLIHGSIRIEVRPIPNR